ncbi:elongation factor G [Ardenticatena maritima]|uniref:Elongation factor G n=1 Tax=Ardenticatena maritima TaxID=872965 RepID=A0A0M9UCD2_9CHLR|nr:elongation factor G [Ardenticatena maritima]KPL86395.1 elongation factor G [Ardenticatena maritima]GAP62818.1 elongation factor G [Ardenticatena maritima]
MKKYAPERLRNVAFVSHVGAGKSTTAEAMLFLTGALTRMGRTEEGNTVSDFDPEERARQISINTSVIPVEYRDHKLNVLDTPGFLDFAGDAISALRVADAAVVVVDASSGPEVGTELMWQYCNDRSLPRLVYVNKMDRDTARWERTLQQLRDTFDARFIPIQIPIGQGASFEGVVDLTTGKAYYGKGDVRDIPAELQSAVEEAQFNLMEAAAEADDELIMKYLDGEELTPDEIARGLKAGVQNGSIVPVLFGASVEALGVERLMEAIVNLLPSPVEAPPEKAVNKETGEEVLLSADPNGPLAVFIFKTLSDPYVGKISFFRVLSGTLKPDMRLYNPRTNTEERIGHIYVQRGKEQIEVKELPAGDIGSVAKLGETLTGDVLCDRSTPLEVEPIKFPRPVYFVAVYPKSQADVDKLNQALTRLTEEDPTLRWERRTDTKQTVMGGLGDVHLDVARARLEQKFGVHVEMGAPKVPYKETITATATAQYRHKKQTGGAGQFAEVHMRVEPLPRGQEFEFASEIFGGAISSVFLPSIEKGIRSVMEQGVLAGYPIVDVKAVVYDGKEHPVDSKDIAFQIAGRECFKLAFKNAKPALLEPIYNVTIIVPDQYTGDVMSDLNTRRARIMGMEQERGKTIIKAQVPLAEMMRYAIDLRSMTQGRGFYTMEPDHYEIVPDYVAQQVIAEAQKEAAEASH